jgi:RNA polymerase-associated protein LEO1
MSDAGNDPTLSDDDEVNGQATPAENAEGSTPLNTVEEHGLDGDDNDDDLFGDGDDAPAEDVPA